MKTIITSLLLLIFFNVSAQDTTNKEPIRLRAYSTMDPNDRVQLEYRDRVQLEYREKCRLDDNKDSIRNVLKKMEYDQFMAIPQSEINLGIHKFKKQHRTGNHLIIVGIASSIIGSLLIVSSTKPSTVISTSSSETITTYPSGVFFTAAGGALLTAGFIVNIDSFRHLK